MRFKNSRMERIKFCPAFISNVILTVEIIMLRTLPYTPEMTTRIKFDKISSHFTTSVPTKFELI